MTSFYDWYADSPVASPQVFGDQTDAPESGDWWDATYLMMGFQRAGDPHAGRTLDGRSPLSRHQGRHGSPDYADNTEASWPSGCPVRRERMPRWRWRWGMSC